MQSLLQFHSDLSKPTEEASYATTGGLQGLFARDMTGLFRLSLHLTADAWKAETCLTHSMRECFSYSTFSKEWAPIWARRTVVRNAIHLVLGTENAMHNEICSEAASHSNLRPSEDRIEVRRDSLAILALPDFDRLVFVICVLERYSILDCARLMKRSPKDIIEARGRAINQVISTEEGNRRDSTTTSPTRPHDAYSNGTGEFDGSCGSLLD